jgi:hypothetical protein
MTTPSGRPLEAVVAGVLGAALGLGTGSLAELVLDAPHLAVAATTVAGASASIAGWRGVYDWRRPAGIAAFVLDSTWGLVMTAAGLFANIVGLVRRDSGYLSELSERQNVQVYRRGFVPRTGFATTLGNVIGGAGDVERIARRQLVTDHEVVHAWQARWLGPLFPLVYITSSALGAVYGIATWALRHRQRSIGRVIETYAYYCNPVEWWAYSRAGQWRPRKMVDHCGWRNAMVRPLARVAARSESVE